MIIRSKSIKQRNKEPISWVSVSQPLVKANTKKQAYYYQLYQPIQPFTYPDHTYKSHKCWVGVCSTNPVKVKLAQRDEYN